MITHKMILALALVSMGAVSTPAWPSVTCQDRPLARELLLVTPRQRAETVLAQAARDIRRVELGSDYSSEAEAEYLNARRMFSAGLYNDAIVFACRAETLILDISNVQLRQPEAARPW